MTTPPSNVFSLEHFSLARDGTYTNVVHTSTHLVAHSAAGATLIPRSAIIALTVAHNRRILVLTIPAEKIQLTVDPEICKAIADWFFGSPIPPHEITALDQTAFESAYRAYLGEIV